MKMLQVLAVLTASGGCAPIQPLVLSNAVGPLQSFADESRTGGSLVVYSDTDGAVLDPGDYSPHSDYKVYTMDGQPVRSVNNRDDMSAREPATLELPVGQYKITAKALKIGFVTVPVVIEKGRTTVVDLKGPANMRQTGGIQSGAYAIVASGSDSRDPGRSPRGYLLKPAGPPSNICT